MSSERNAVNFVLITILAMSYQYCAAQTSNEQPACDGVTAKTEVETYFQAFSKYQESSSVDKSCLTNAKTDTEDETKQFIQNCAIATGDKIKEACASAPGFSTDTDTNKAITKFNDYVTSCKWNSG